MRRRIPIGLAWCVGLVMFAAPAAAQEPGVFVDPESPTGKEYAIPLESARRQADPSGADQTTSAGRSQAAAPTGAAAPPFGSGIEPAGQREDAGGRGGSRGAAAPGSRATPGADRSASSAVSLAVSNPGSPEGGIDTALLVAGAGALVLAIGAAVGVGLRRRRIS